MTGVEDDELCDVDWRLSLCYYHSQMMVRHRGSVRDLRREEAFNESE